MKTKKIKIEELNTRDTYVTDSNMGGVFRLKYQCFSKSRNRHIFNNISPGWESFQYNFLPDRIEREIRLLV